MKWAEEVTLTHATDRALLCDYEGQEFWIPKSQVDDDSEIYSSQQVGETGVLVIPYWLAEEKGMS